MNTNQINNSIVKIGTHNGVFHLDEVGAVATLKRYFSAIQVVRTRDPKILSTCALRVDVGGNYNPETGDFDHHQGLAFNRPTGHPYSSFGLVWKKYGAMICDGSQQVADIVDSAIVAPADALDSGYNLWDSNCVVQPYTLSHIVNSMNPGWDEMVQDFDWSFDQAVCLVGTVLDREITRAWGIVNARDEVKKAIQSAGKYDSGIQGTIIVFERFVPWQAHMDLFSEKHLYVIFPAVGGKQWNVQCVPPTPGSFEQRKPLPKEWADAPAGQIANVSRCSSAVFCHKGRFICGAQTMEGAIEMARNAVLA